MLWSHLIKIKKNIKKFREAKYQKILFSKKDLVLRNKAIRYIIDLETNKITNDKFCFSCEFYLKNLRKKNFISFYKKFNTHLNLKEKYNLQSLKKKTNKNACLKSYIIFSKFLIKNENIKNIEKLNTILKLNDLFILKFEKHKHINLVKYFIKNIQYEKKLIKLFT